ncbi:unnamed protein product [Rotaria magnacalcarata]|uniref:Uncharacterized protein n=1 Tax=Rotaria magnacalcarata TaxID=392030 RepID=A0A820HUS0_9BILA|nr:unnamed protein product [Rotaria magnacalcarata]
MRFALIVSNAAVARPALRLNAQNFHMGDTTLNYVFYKPSDYYNQLKKSLQLIQQNARDQSNYSHMNNKKYYDRNRSNPHYDINDTILIRIHGLRSKLDPQFTLTPKIAIQKQHPTYWVRDQMNDQITRVHVHSIPQHLSSFIVLFELNHLSSSNTLLFEKINLLFRFLFRLGNTIFSWGSMNTELQSVICMNLFTWLSLALLINSQDAFPGWYSRAQPFCKVCCPAQLSTTIMSSNYSCTCSNASPYVNPGEKWSLQNAIRYTVNFFLDKSATRKNWSIVLDPNYSPLSSYEQRKRIDYAIYDCFAVTFFYIKQYLINGH